MATTQKENTKKTTELPQTMRRKITASIVKMSEQEKGFCVKGIFKGQSVRPWMDPATGEQKEIVQFHFEDKLTLERFNIFADAGLNNAINSSAVKEGDYIEIEKLGKVAMGNGRTVNTYDIYALD